MNQTIDTIEIADLEYDVAAAGALEPAESQVNNSAALIVYFNWK